MRKIKVKTLYLIAIVVGGLIGLATKSTYAIFTSSAEIDNPICMATNLTSEEEVVDTMDVVVASGEVKEVPIAINNTSNSTLNYMVFYEKLSNNIEIGINMSKADSSNSSGTIDVNETKKVYVQIKNNESSSITVTIGVVSNNISSSMEMIPSGKEGETAIKVGDILAEYITNLYTEGTKTTVTNNSVTYNYVSSEWLMNDRLGSSSTDINAGNIRYYGANPNNYIYFNCSDYGNQSSSTCEVWRIIGIFDGKVKIMRNGTIGVYSWDGGNTNEWSTATLMRLLNSGYSAYVGGSLYWNAGSGSCYIGAGTTASCDFGVTTSTPGLKNDTTRNMVAKTVYYLRGYNSKSTYANIIYDKERVSGSVYTGRSVTWSGYIAVPYASDYAYAVDLSLCKQQLGSYGDSTCINNNWMKNIITNNGTKDGYLLTPVNSLANAVWYVSLKGAVYLGESYYSVGYSQNIVPVMHLSNINIDSSTDGSIDNPYKIVLS